MSDLPTFDTRDVVVMAHESSTPELRALLRERGMRIPPALARPSWGPAVIRRAVEQPAEGELSVATSDHAVNTPRAPTPPAAPAPPSPIAPQPAPPPIQELVTSDQRPAGYPGTPESYPGWQEQAAHEFQPPAATDYPPPQPNQDEATGAYPPVDIVGGTYPPPAALPQQGYGKFEPATMQIDVQRAAAIADGMMSPGIGESTTQASHRNERLDLSDWGYLLRVVMIADPNDPQPRVALDGMRFDVGTWLQQAIDQPARLEYDRRFRKDVEQQLAKFLTERIGRFPVIKVDIQYIQ